MDGSAVSAVHRSAGGLHRHDRVPRRRADYVTLSPIYPTVTKPGYGPALGPEGAAALAGSIPWLALGGIDSPERAAACAAAGARGIAVLGAVMRAADPESVCRSLASAFDASALAAAFDASALAAAFDASALAAAFDASALAAASDASAPACGGAVPGRGGGSSGCAGGSVVAQ